ncbi:MAG TPA: sugar-binding protein [Clostridia bacterium]|nr:sugar-binding protein [Clostridia bacterium]
MKKQISLLASITLIMCFATSVLAYTEGKNLEAPKAQNVVIDGDLSEWDTARGLKIDDQSQIIDQIEHWDGVEDCSMEIYVMWDEENLYVAMKIMDDTPLVYREGFPLDELDSVILFLSTDPLADPERTEYTATDWRIVQSADRFNNNYDFFIYVDREMIADNKGWGTRGEYGDELVFDDYEGAIVKVDGGIVWEGRIPLHNLSNADIPRLVPAAGMTVGFDFSILDVDLPCPGIHSLRIQSSARLDGRDRTPAMHDVDRNPSLWGTLTFVE